MRNLVTTLPRRRRAGGMTAFDGLPPDLRRWLTLAALPWSPHSALRLWIRLSRECRGDRSRMLERLDRAEARMLARDRSRLP